MKFKDFRKWGQWSFLDFLEANGVQYKYDGELLSFADARSEEKARSIWYNLTGQEIIGVVQ